MSIHNDRRKYGTDEEREEWRQDLIREYRTEQAGLYHTDEEEYNCENCRHNTYLYTRANGVQVFECPFSTCEYEEVEALEFSADIDTPGKWQDKDGEWHEGRIPQKGGCHGNS